MFHVILGNADDANLVFKGQVHLHKHKDWENATILVEHISESLRKIGQSMQKLWIFKIFVLEPLDEETTTACESYAYNSIKKM